MRRSVRDSALIAALAALALLGACQSPGGVPANELPGDAIAFSYRSPEEARRRADDFDDELRARAQQASRRVEGPSVVGSGAQVRADMSELGTFLESAFGTRGRGRTRHQGRLALLDPSTAEMTLIEGALRGALPVDWSPDHSRLLYAQAAPGGTDVQLWEYDLAQRTVRPMTHGPAAHTQGCYGPDGRIVVTVASLRTHPPRSEIWISQPGGREPYVQISGGPADHSPSCASDGRALVYTRSLSRDRVQLVVRSPLLTGAPRPLTTGKEARFSSSGEWLVYSAKGRQGWSLWRIRPDGSGRAPVGRSVRDELRPALSPDGRFVTYVASEVPPRVHLYLRRLDGTGDRILFADGDGEYPVW